MKYIKTLLVFCLMANLSFAEDFPVYDDRGYEKESDSFTNNDELSKISLLEKEVQNLTGRIEILEHMIAQIQNGSKVPFKDTGKSNNELLKPVQAAASADPREEKREYDLALSNLKDGKYEEAEMLFADFMKKYTKSDHLSNAYFWYADTFYRRGDLDKAAINFLKAYQKFPASAKAPDALLKLALSLGEMKKNDEACSILKKLDTEFKKRSDSSKKRCYDAKIKYGCK